MITTYTDHKTLLKSEVYKLLSIMYMEPREDLRINVQLLLAALEEFDDTLYSLCEKMDGLFDEEPQDLEEYIVEYSKLFVGPFKLYAPPYASIYLEDKWEVMGRSTQTIESFYQRVGLTINSINLKPSDHISLQLEFMYYLNFKWNETGNLEYLEIQKEFLYRILTHWIPKFNAAIQHGANLKLYKILGNITESFIKQDFSSLK